LYHARASSSLLWTHAHNSYLQSIAELGLPAAAILLFAVAAVIATLLRGLPYKSEPQPAGTAALAATAAVAFHSTIDFSVHIQAVGVTLAVLVGAGLGETLARNARRTDQSTRQTSAIDPPSQPREIVNVSISPRTAAPDQAGIG